MDHRHASIIPMPGKVGMMSGHRATNSLLQHAQPLFWTLHALSPDLESAAHMDVLQTEARSGLGKFRSACRASSLHHDAIEAVHYCFCAAMDQAGSRIRGRADSCRGLWLQRSLLKEYYKENGSGEQCRPWIAKLQRNGKRHADALEVIGHLISRGLRDERGAPISNYQGVVPQRHDDSLSPAAMQYILLPPAVLEPATLHVLAERKAGRVWLARWVGAGIALLCILAYFLYRQHNDNQALVREVEQLSARVLSEQASMDQRMARLLAPEIASGTTSLGKTGDRVFLLFSSDSGFAANSAVIKPQLARQLDQLGTVLDDTDGLVTVIGHADASLGAYNGEAVNLALSQARAMAVGRYLQEKGAAGGRITVLGRGSADPIADNGTETGRALNRRIEIVIDRSRRDAAPATSGGPPTRADTSHRR
ncbi:OmpA family protein [Cupriavidus sp. SW-Y-13]|nr:OmpA family protein [Cupriavidus sp. SW-Y-13]